MSGTGESLVRAERTGRLLVVRMCRESKRNAVNRQLADELDAAFNLLEDDDDLWAGVLTGTGSVFCAGSDLTAGGDYLTERGGEYGLMRRQRRKPLIAAVEGPALGGGMELVLACDLVVASRTARFGLPEVSRGVVATSGALFMAPRGLPASVARELLLTGEPIDADRGYAIGLVNQVTEPGDAVAASLVAVNRWLAAAAEFGWQVTADAQAAIGASQDYREGIAAFLEKRPPRWTGR